MLLSLHVPVMSRHVLLVLVLFLLLLLFLLLKGVLRLFFSIAIILPLFIEDHRRFTLLVELLLIVVKIPWADLSEVRVVLTLRSMHHQMSSIQK